MKLYCLSGLGVDRRAFQNINAEGVELIHIDWIDPLPAETLQNYAKRLFSKVQPEDGYNIIGVSFGGMIATEFSKIKKPNKLFLVSTINNRSQLNLLFKIGSALRLHKLIPSSMARKSNFITNFLFSLKDGTDKDLLAEILKDTDPVFLKWAIDAITKWNNKIKPSGIVIHGSKDRILPLKANVQYSITGGGHFMIVNRADEISLIIEKEGV
ncbi:MAG: alpha/beta hydrolase [Crocinitomicaceae bacterium]|nr:alpha/beta hydrolase [Crocinitomicaceae bacterium]